MENLRRSTPRGMNMAMKTRSMPARGKRHVTKGGSRDKKECHVTSRDIAGPWLQCSNSHCRRLEECQNREACGSFARPESAVPTPWPDDDDISEVVRASGAKIKPHQLSHHSAILYGRDPPKISASDDKTRSPQRTPRDMSIPGRTNGLVQAAVSPQALEDLTPPQQLFVREYLVDLNATQASIRAGHSEHCASEIGYENLRKPQIMAAIDSAFMELGGVTRSRIVDELGAIAFSDIGNIVNWEDENLDLGPGDIAVIEGEEVKAGKEGITRIIRSKVRILASANIDPSLRRVIAEVSQTDRNSLKVKLYDKISALDKLARALGMYQKIDDLGSKDASMVATIIYEGPPDGH
jgi:phage terminase small subunit